MTTKLNMLQAIDRKLSGVIATTDRKAQLLRKINATLDHAVKSMDGWITLNGNSGEDESGGSHVFVGKGGQIEKGGGGNHRRDNQRDWTGGNILANAMDLESYIEARKSAEPNQPAPEAKPSEKVSNKS